jgi:solute carrier family 25 phosphate transporter 23/24/25/41
VKGFEGLGTIASFQKMYAMEGWLGFFKGNGATVLKIAPFSAAEFYFYEVYKNALFPGKTRNELSYGQKLIAGGLTGMTSQTLTYPLDLLKTYLTINIENNTRVSMWEQSKIIVAQRGFFGMF